MLRDKTAVNAKDDLRIVEMNFMKNSSIKLALMIIFGFVSLVNSQNKVIPLWDNIPGSIESVDYKEEFRVDPQGKITGIKKVTTPTLKIFLAENTNTKNAAVIICPGGAYAVLSHEKEGDKVAAWFQSIGVSAFVLKYRLPNDVIMNDKTIGPLQDAQEAVRTLRRHASEWNLDPAKIGIIGFSAGGHLAATLSTRYNDKVYESKDALSARPDFSILVYPVISMEESITHKGSKENLLGKNPSNEIIAQYSNEKQVDANTPKTFLVHATDDKAVPVENSINYYLALKQHQVSAEMHLYEHGGHGFGLGVEGTNTSWPKDCEKWLLANGLIQKP